MRCRNTRNNLFKTECVLDHHPGQALGFEWSYIHCSVFGWTDMPLKDYASVEGSQHPSSF